MSPLLKPVDHSIAYGRILVACAVLSSFAALYGLGRASDPNSYDQEAGYKVQAPTEQDYWAVPDTSHNKRIFAIRAALEVRGFHLNGGSKVNGDPLAGIRGVYSYVAPNDDYYPLEWRLMATRCATCEPVSFLRLLVSEEGFTPGTADRVIDEWRRAQEWMPGDVIAAGERLLRDLGPLHRADRDGMVSAASPAPETVEVVERSWTEYPNGARRYRLKMRQDVGQYLLDLQLTDRVAAEGELSSCDIVLQFRWRP